MKKRTIAVLLAVCVAAACVLTGCGSDLPYGQYNLSDYITVENYKGLEVEKSVVSVSNEEIQTQVKANVEESKKTEQVKEGKVAKGDKVNIDYEGKIDGKAFDGGSAEGYDLEIGSNSFIEGFETQLIGKEVGSTSDLNLTFPKDYQSAELAGKAVVFTVKVNYISKETTPKYDEQWIQENSDVKTKKAYEAQVKEDLLKQKEDEVKNTQISDLFGQVVSASKVKKYPEEEVEAYVVQIEAQYASYAKEYGVEVADLWKQEGMTSEKEYADNNEQAAQQAVQQQMIIFYIADKEKLTYTDEEEQKLRDDIEKQGATEETILEQTGMDMDTYIATALTSEKVGDFLYDNAEIVEKKSTTKN